MIMKENFPEKFVNSLILLNNVTSIKTSKDWRSLKELWKNMNRKITDIE